MKTLFIILITFCAFTAKAQFEPVSSVEIGYKNRKIVMYNNDDFTIFEYPDFSIYSNIEIGISFKNLYLTSNIINNFYKYSFDNINFSPFLSEYHFDFYYKSKKLKIGYKHFCSHKVNSRFYISNDIHINDSFDNLYIKFTLR
jgi:hypothetical protein